MKVPFKGAIDCDIHPAPPSVQALLPYLDDHWREEILTRYIERSAFVLTSYPPNAPLAARPDWRPTTGQPAGDLDRIRREALDPFGSRFAICNVLHGAIALFNEDLAMALCAAVNDWTAKELLDREPRLRGSILVHAHTPEIAAAEIERVARDRRFVQVLLVVMGERLLGKRVNWPIFAAAEKHGLAIGIHAGATYRQAPTSSGWPSFRIEDYVQNSTAAEGQIVSLLSEGTFNKFPDLKFVMSESGFTWLPTLLWRTSKEWRGVRTEVPWIDRVPSEILRERVRFTLQPVDVPSGDPRYLERILEHIGSDRLILFSTDYPHWQFEGEDVLPEGLPQGIMRKLLFENALETYPRLRDDTVGGARKGNEETVT